jgi:hypothetical protein
MVNSWFSVDVPKQKRSSEVLGDVLAEDAGAGWQASKVEIWQLRPQSPAMGGQFSDPSKKKQKSMGSPPIKKGESRIKKGLVMVLLFEVAISSYIYIR